MKYVYNTHGVVFDGYFISGHVDITGNTVEWSGGITEYQDEEQTINGVEEVVQRYAGETTDGRCFMSTEKIIKLRELLSHDR